ncbi:MAG: NEW3 domain-containing protein [Actinophytocola sp.]|uniref:NEW3 domain-containing protein n=1 Tax=Actinophytocola sp. TaxID=1872138 RepID=UPI003D6AC4BD
MPDGSSFQLQHWTHEFRYALAAGSGDWRSAGIAATSAEFSRPLHAVLASPTTEPSLPASGSLLRAEGARLAVVKAAGNPLVSGSAAAVDPRRRIAVRLVGADSAAAARLESDVVRLADLWSANLLEEPGATLDAIEVDPSDAVTVLATPVVDSTAHSTVDGPALGAEAEPAQPLYAKYWLHNRGPAPLGGLPLAAHLDPTRVDVTPGGSVPLRLTVASDCTDADLHGVVRLVPPPGWTVDVPEVPFGLPPGGHLSIEVTVTAPADAVAGRHPVRALLKPAAAAGLPPSWGQVVEDVAVLTVGSPAGDLLRFAADPAPVRVRAGTRERLAVRVVSGAAAPIAVEAAVISPWGTWECVGPRSLGAELPAGGEVELAFDVEPPPWTPPGRWWALVRVVGAGRLLYSPAVPLEVLA